MKSQNILESIGLICLLGSAVSKTNTDCPRSLVSFHQRKPTRSLPEIFLVFQKSAAKSSITTMKKRI